jgi:hypothetical protein
MSTLVHHAHLGTSRHKLSAQGCLYVPKGPAYLNVLFGFGARTPTGMAELTKRAIRLLLLGIEPKSLHHLQLLVHIHGLDHVYTVGQNPCTVVRIQTRWEISYAYGTVYMAY